MSTKSHFIYEDGIEGYSDCSEPQSIFGKWVGDNAYLIIEPRVLKSVKLKGDYLHVETKETEHLPKEMKIWGDAVLEMDIDEDGLMIILKGGHYITKQIIEKNFPTEKGTTYKTVFK